MANKTANSGMLSALGRPVSALEDNFIKTINKGMIIGKDKTDIKVTLFPALALIPETIVNTVAKLVPPKTTAVKNKNTSFTGLLNIVEYTRKANKANTSIKSIL